MVCSFPLGGLLSIVGFGGPEGPPGEAQVDVVEGRPRDGHRGDVELGVLQRHQHRGHGAGAILGAGVQGAVVSVEDLVESVDARQCLTDRRLVEPLVAELDVDRVAAQFPLQLVGGSLGDDPALVDDRQLRRQL